MWWRRNVRGSLWGYVPSPLMRRTAGETPQRFLVLWGLWLFSTGRRELQTARELGEHLLALAERVDEPMRRGDGCEGCSRASRVGRAREGRWRSGARDAIGTVKVFRSGHDDLSATGGHHG